MKLIYKGKYNGDPASLPCREHEPGAVQFKEFDNMKQFAVILNVLSVLLIIPLIAGVYLRADVSIQDLDFIGIYVGVLLSLVAMFPHEFLHAICFKKEVYLYTNWKQGMLFVTGPETMSKGRFVFMSMLPNLVFGFLPYLVFMLFPRFAFLGSLGAFSIAAGAGDYYNVFNALRQMPKGARTYMHGIHSYWYMPK